MKSEYIQMISSLGTLFTVLIAVLKLAARFGRVEALLEKHCKDLDHSFIKIRDIEAYLRSPAHPVNEQDKA